jgi:hypothetical protein
MSHAVGGLVHITCQDRRRRHPELAGSVPVAGPLLSVSPVRSSGLIARRQNGSIAPWRVHASARTHPQTR